MTDLEDFKNKLEDLKRNISFIEFRMKFLQGHNSILEHYLDNEEFSEYIYNCDLNILLSHAEQPIKDIYQSLEDLFERLEEAPRRGKNK